MSSGRNRCAAVGCRSWCCRRGRCAFDGDHRSGGKESRRRVLGLDRAGDRSGSIGAPVPSSSRCADRAGSIRTYVRLSIDLSADWIRPRPSTQGAPNSMEPFAAQQRLTRHDTDTARSSSASAAVRTGAGIGTDRRSHCDLGTVSSRSGHSRRPRRAVAGGLAAALPSRVGNLMQAAGSGLFVPNVAPASRGGLISAVELAGRAIEDHSVPARIADPAAFLLPSLIGWALVCGGLHQRSG